MLLSWGEDMTLNHHQELLDSIKKIKKGDLVERNNLIKEYKPFIWKTAFALCKRKLDWGIDDELSEALIGFNDALDAYQEETQVPFLPFAKVVIHNRLKDYFRKQGKYRIECPFEFELHEGDLYNPADAKAAWEDFHNKTIEEERQEEIERFERLIESFGIEFEDLVLVSPKHRDSRETLFNVAKTLVGKDDLMEYFLSKKQLPLKSLMRATKVNKKTLERGRKFIIATALVLHYKHDFIYLWSYINLR